MSSKKFNEAEAKYKKTKKWEFIGYMAQQASSYDDHKKVAQYIIDVGIYKPNMPENTSRLQRSEQWLIPGKAKLLAAVLNNYRRSCNTEEQLLQYIKASLENDLWMVRSFHYIDRAPDSTAIEELVDVATTFDAFYFLYRYDYYDEEKTASYLQQLEALATNPEQTKEIENASKIVKEKVEWLNELD